MRVLHKAAAAAFLTMGVGAEIGLGGPLPSITKSGATIQIEDWAQMPATLGGSARTRINFLREEPGGSNRLWVNDLQGQLYTVNKSTRQATTYLNLQTMLQQNGRTLQTSGGLSAGFLSFQFHPEYATNGKLYTVHLEDQSANSPAPTFSSVPTNQLDKQVVLTEWTTNNPAASTFQGTWAANRREIMRVGTGSNKHEHPMGDLMFNPSARPGDTDYGIMYIAQGDYGMANAGRYDLLQTPNSVFGSTLRIDPSGNNSANGQYGIPADNPYASDGNPATLGEVYAIGHRNSHRFYWDETDGRLYNFDIGHSDIEEVNVIRAGKNYGWANREGTFAKTPNNVNSPLTNLPANDATLGYTYPVAQYDHDEGASIAGGVAYHGTSPGLNGKMLIGDIVNGRLFAADLDDIIASDDDQASTYAALDELTVIHNGTLKPNGLREIVQGLTGNSRVDLRFGWDEEGHVYLMSKTDGWIRRLTVVPEPSSGLAAVAAGMYLLHRKRRRSTDE